MSGNYDNIQIEIDEKGNKSFYIKNDSEKVSFIISMIILEDDDPNGKYLIKVREITNLFVPQDVVREFFQKDEKEKAISTLKTLIEDYKALSNATLPPIDPRKVFNDAVNYHLISPNCCGNCIHSVFLTQDPHSDRKTGNGWFCNCKKNVRQHEYLRDDYSGHYYSYIEVNQFGICNNHFRKEGPWNPNAPENHIQ